MIRQAFQMGIKYILTTTGAAKLKGYYEHILGVTAVFRASSQCLNCKNIDDTVTPFLNEITKGNMQG